MALTFLNVIIPIVIFHKHKNIIIIEIEKFS